MHGSSVNIVFFNMEIFENFLLNQTNFHFLITCLYVLFGFIKPLTRNRLTFGRSFTDFVIKKFLKGFLRKSRMEIASWRRVFRNRVSADFFLKLINL